MNNKLHLRRFTEILILLTLLNSLYNSVMAGLGFNWPYSTFLFTPDDVFADLFKTALSYPGPAISNELLTTWPSFIIGYASNISYQGVDGLNISGALTNLHHVPVGTLMAISVRWLLSVFSPEVVFLMSNALWFLALVFFCFRITGEWKKAVAGIAVIVISYPMVFALSRGHFYSALMAVSCFIFAAQLFGKNINWLALASAVYFVALRPNAITLLALTPLFMGFRHSLAFILKTVALVAIVNFAAYSISAAIYDGYNLKNFLLGLERYREIYVFGHGGLAYGSSLLGLIKVLAGAGGSKLSLASILLVEKVSFVVSAVLLGSVILLVRLKRLSAIDGVFVALSTYFFASSVIADYYLTVFFLIPIFFVIVELDASSSGVVTKEPHFVRVPWLSQIPVSLFASAVLLSPKNYFFVHGVSFQVALNPMIMIISSLYILLKTFSRDGQFGLRRA